MAFILRPSKYVNSFLGLARRASLTFRRKKILLEYTNIFKYNDLWFRTVATASPKPITVFPMPLDKSIHNLYNNLKASMIDLFNVQFALNLVIESGVMTPSQLILFLKCCGSAAFKDSEENRINMAKKIWQTAKELGTELDIAHFNTLLSVYVENNHRFSHKDILLDIKEAGLEPNRITYRHLLKAFCQEGDIQGASNILEQIKEKEFPINEYDFCSLIQAHCEAGELNEAAKIFTVMKDKGIQPSLDPYIYLLCGYAKHGNVERMNELLDELNDLNLQITDTYLLNIVYTLIVNNRTEHIDSVLARMKKNVDYEKTLMKVVHRIFLQNKDEEALKLFRILSKMDFVPEFIQDQAHSVVDNFLSNRSPKELTDICRKIQDEGWSRIAFSYALKKAVLRSDLEYCQVLLGNLKSHDFPIRSNYFWPLIVRYSQHGNSGIISVLKVMRSLGVPICAATMQMFIKDYYTFSNDWIKDIEIFAKVGVKESTTSNVILMKFLESGNIKKAELIASTQPIYKPQWVLLEAVAKCFNNNPSNEEKFINTLYYLAHDFHAYNSNDNKQENDVEEDTDWTGLNTFYDVALKRLSGRCSEEVFLNVLQKASKKKLLIPSFTADAIQANFSSPDIASLLKEFTESDEFELSEEILKKKYEKAAVISKTLDPNGLQNLANKGDARAEEIWEELGSKATLDDHLAMLSMHMKLKEYEKGFKVIDRMKSCSEHGGNNNHLKKKFRICLHLLGMSGDVEKVIYAYRVGVYLGLISEDRVESVIRTILNCCDVDTAVKEHWEFFEKVKQIKIYIEVMQHVLPSQNTEVIQKLTHNLGKLTKHDIAFTALFTAYLASGYNAKAKELLECQSFKFQNSVFLWWFKNLYYNKEKSFDDIMEVIKQLRPANRYYVYEFLLHKFKEEKDYDKIKLLWLQCQEDDSTDPFLLENLRRCMVNKENESFEGAPLLFSDSQLNEEKAILDLLRNNKYTQETLDKLLSGKLPPRIARKMLPVLASEGKSFELVLVQNKYRFGRFTSEIATELLKMNKVKEFLEFVTAQVSMKKYGNVYNCFAFARDLILPLVKTNEDLFQKTKEIALRCYNEGKYEALLVFFIRLCIQLPDKLQEAEALLDTNDSHIVSHFRNYALSNLLLGSSEEMDFYKNILQSEKIKCVFSEALNYLYDRVISFYNQNEDVESALSYLEKARQDGVEGKLSKGVISSLKKKVEDKGTSFPYPQLLQEAA